MNDLAGQIGAPALFGYGMDSDCVVVEAAAPESGAWTTCLARSAMAGYLGAEKEGLTLEDYFLEPRDAAERCRGLGRGGRAHRERRGVGGGLSADPGADPGAGRGSGPDAGPDGDAEAGSVAENLFFRFLDRLGVEPLATLPRPSHAVGEVRAPWW